MQTGFGEIMTEVTMLLLRVLSLIGQLYPKIAHEVMPIRSIFMVRCGCDV